MILALGTWNMYELIMDGGMRVLASTVLDKILFILIIGYLYLNS